LTRIRTDHKAVIPTFMELPMPYFFDPDTRTPKELLPGVVVRTFWGEQMLISQVDLAPGAIVPVHAHPHEQFGMIVRGEMQITIAGETRNIQTGAIYIIPGDAQHSVITGAGGAQLIEAFSPVREEYKFPD
jgi:quercetin dioxygenase-like cupin family protein